jgi:threonine 3-dehydrogenase
MLALRKTEAGPGGLALNEIDMPEPKAGEVLLRVKATGICGTDLHIHQWIPAFRHIKLPIVMGHEMAGVVEAVGAGVDRVKPGDRVAVESHIPCMRCYTCLMGSPHNCGNTRYPGIHIDGGMASHVVLPELILHPIGDTVPVEMAAMLEPFGIAVHTSLEGRGVAGMNVLVAGCGPIGLMNVMVARAFGANRIIATDVNPMRLRLAGQLGADRLVNVNDDDVATAVRETTGGRGVDVYLEYSGAAASLAQAGELVAGGGEIRLVGVPSDAVELNVKRWINKGLTVRGIHGRRIYSTWLHAMKLLEDKKVDLQPLVSHILPLREALRGFEEAVSGRAVKVLFIPD